MNHALTELVRLIAAYAVTRHLAERVRPRSSDGSGSPESDHVIKDSANHTRPPPLTHCPKLVLPGHAAGYDSLYGRGHACERRFTPGIARTDSGTRR
jgi:hypothetical protein